MLQRMWPKMLLHGTLAKVLQRTVVLFERGYCRAGKPSAGRLGKFLVQAQFQGSVHSSALFLTAAAQNLLCMKLASELGVNIPNPWVTWFKGALVPAALGLLITPLIIFKVCITESVPSRDSLHLQGPQFRVGVSLEMQQSMDDQVQGCPSASCPGP